jgi:glycine dehydrogenase subunit 1
VADYLPHTDAEVEDMLGFLGLASLDELFGAVPAALRLAGGLDLDEGSPEPDVLAELDALASRNRPIGPDLVCFAGAGAYDHEVPAVVRALAGRSEFVTAYTPYQAEVAQGVLQAVFEFQTMIARLAGLPVANASLYDGGSSLVEALNLCAGATGRSRVLLSSGVHPHWRAVAATMARGTGHVLDEVPLRDGRTDWDAVGEGDEVAAVVVAQPNWLGCLEDVADAKARADTAGALLVVAADPIAHGVLRSPGSLGADVVVGEGQALGTRLSFGGPYLGLFACSRAQMRRLPGRLVGETADVEGTRGYVTTLRAREQDIRREKATSNVCTNQTLMAVTAAIQLSWLGPAGLAEVATRCAQAAHYCCDQLTSNPGVTVAVSAPFLREFTVRTDQPAGVVLARLADEGFLGGIAASALRAPGDASLPDGVASNAVVVAVTERRTRAEIDAFATAFAKAAR